MWDTDSAANRPLRVPGDLAVNASSMASSSESAVAISSTLQTMDSIVAGGSSITTAAAATRPMISDISLGTGVPGLVNSRLIDLEPVEAA